MQVEFIPFLPLGMHPGMDALVFGLARGLAMRGHRLRLRNQGAMPLEHALRAGIREGAEAIYLFVTNPLDAAAAVGEAMDAGVKIFTFHEAAFAVSGSIVIPNFYQGVELSRQLAGRVPAGGRIAIVGGPAILDDEELVLGCVDGARRFGLKILNDPMLTMYRNLEDVRGASEAIVARIMDDFYPFDGLVVFNDETLHDVVALLEDRGLAGRFPIVSRNGSPAAIEFIKRGLSSVTLDYRLPEIGALGAELIEGKTRRILAPLGEIFDRANAHEYRDWSLRAPAMELEPWD